MGKLYIFRLPISYSVYVSKIMKIDWQLTKLLQKISGLLFLAHPVDRAISNVNQLAISCGALWDQLGPGLLKPIAYCVQARTGIGLRIALTEIRCF